MAKQSTVQLQKIVPLSWLSDYVRMLRNVRAQPSGIDTVELDAAIDRRIMDVQAYIDRLQQGQLQ